MHHPFLRVQGKKMRARLESLPDDKLRCSQCVEEGLEQIGSSFFYCLNPLHEHSEDEEFIGGEYGSSVSYTDDDDSSSYEHVSNGICDADYCGNPIEFSCTGCQEAWYCSEKCQYSDWKDHKIECDISDPFNWKKHGLFTTVEHAIDDMVGDSYEDDDLQVAGELIEQELLDLDSEEEPSPELHKRAVNFIEAAEIGPNMYQLIYEHPLGEGDPELLQLVEDHIEGMIKEHEDLQEEWHIGANVAHRNQLSQDIKDGEALYDEIAFHIERGQSCPGWLREEGVGLIGMRRRRRRKKKRKKRKRKRKKKKATKKRKGNKSKRKKKRKGKKSKDKKRRKKKANKDKKKGLSKDERMAEKKKKRKTKDKKKQKSRKEKDRSKNKKRKKKDKDKSKKKKDKGDRKDKRKKRDKKERGDGDGKKKKSKKDKDRKRKKRKDKEDSRDKKKDKSKKKKKDKDRRDADGGGRKKKKDKRRDDDDSRGRSRSPTRRDRRPSPTRRRNPSPTRRRSPSPTRRRSPSPTRDRDDREGDLPDASAPSESGGDGDSQSAFEKFKERSRERRERAEVRRERRDERKERAEDRKERLKEAKASTDEAREELKQAELERRRVAQEPAASQINDIYLY